MLGVACAERGDCAACHIVVEPYSTFGASDGDGALASYPKVGPELGGMRLVMQPDVSDLARRFSVRGRFQGLVGRVGDGPGEFRSVAHAMRSGDSLLLFDTRAQRMVVMQPPDRIVRTTPWMSHTNSSVELADGSLVSTDAVWLPGRPFEHLTRDGQLLKRFGDSLSANERARIIAAAPDGSFWAAPRLRRLEFEHWASPDQRLDRFEIVTPHYAPYDAYIRAAPSQAPSSSLRGFWVSADQHLWLVIEVPGTEWLTGYGEPRRGEGGGEYRPLVDWEAAWATVIMEYDPSTRTVIRERRVEEAFVQVVEPGLIMRFSQDQDGWYHAHLYRVRAASAR